MDEEVTEQLIRGSNVRSDWIDLRDQIYSPSLTILRDSVSIDPKLMSVDPDTGLQTPVFGIRNQGNTGRCVGFALANLIDVQRNLLMVRRSPEINASSSLIKQIRENVVSADMLYRMAYFHDRYPDLEEEVSPSSEGVRTLRSAIKGFYHHGACLDWPYDTDPTDAGRWQSTSVNPGSVDRNRLRPSVPQSKKAREIGLGAYYRLASVLNHFHTALNEVEAILVSANVHDGWIGVKHDTGGEISWPPSKGILGTHAFVITGYDENGFHVLNSWGKNWGGYKGQAGVALWRYADWAKNVIDSWVLRLGVPAPSAFAVSIGENGTKGAVAPVQLGSTPCFELVGHYMHLDDGFHVSSGSYPSMRSDWQTTYAYLTNDICGEPDTRSKDASRYRGILIWIPGSLEGIAPAFTAAVQRKNAIKELGLYPYNIFWCNSFVEKSLEVLDIIFESCKAQAGEDAEHLDSLIEQSVQGVGRAFWRDIEISARRAVRGTGELPHEPDESDTPKRVQPGFVRKLFDDLLRLKTEHGCELHIVAEGAGALMVHEILSHLKGGEADHDSKRTGVKDAVALIDSLHLVHPAIGMPRARKLILPLVQEMNGEITGKRKRASRSQKPNVQPLLSSKDHPRARIYVPTEELEESVHFGSYGKSILHLVARAFEDRHLAPLEDVEKDQPPMRAPRQFLGMASIADDDDFPTRGAIYRLNRVVGQTRVADMVTQTDLNRDPTITEEIFNTIKSRRNSK